MPSVVVSPSPQLNLSCTASSMSCFRCSGSAWDFFLPVIIHVGELILIRTLQCGYNFSYFAMGDLGSIPVLGRSSGGGHGNPLHYSCLENLPWTEESCGLQFMGWQRVGHNWATKHSAAFLFCRWRNWGLEKSYKFLQARDYILVGNRVRRSLAFRPRFSLVADCAPQRQCQIWTHHFLGIHVLLTQTK